MLGILGLGSRSTLHYVKRLNEEYHKKHGGYSTMPFKLLNVNFDQINPFLPDQFTELIPVVSASLSELNHLGISKILVPNITLHETIDKTPLNVEIRDKIVHPLDVLSNSEIYKNYKDVCILGTAHTMSNPYLIEKLKLNVKLLTADKTEQIDNLRKQVYSGTEIREQHVTFLNDLIKKHSNTLFIIACTELSIVVSLYPPHENMMDLVEWQIAQTIV